MRSAGDKERKAPQCPFYLSNCGARTIRVFNGDDFYPQFRPPFPQLIHFVGLLGRFLVLLGLDDIFTRRIFVNSSLKLLDAAKRDSERNRHGLGSYQKNKTVTGSKTWNMLKRSTV
jgi:hypothetical protein